MPIGAAPYSMMSVLVIRARVAGSDWERRNAAATGMITTSPTHFAIAPVNWRIYGGTASHTMVMINVMP